MFVSPRHLKRMGHSNCFCAEKKRPSRGPKKPGSGFSEPIEGLMGIMRGKRFSMNEERGEEAR
jgi:hypothetical protein